MCTDSALHPTYAKKAGKRGKIREMGLLRAYSCEMHASRSPKSTEAGAAKSRASTGNLLQHHAEPIPIKVLEKFQVDQPTASSAVPRWPAGVEDKG